MPRASVRPCVLALWLSVGCVGVGVGVGYIWFFEGEKESESSERTHEQMILWIQRTCVRACIAP